MSHLTPVSPTPVSPTRRDPSRARYDTIVNGLRLKAAAGALREDDLIPVNDLRQK